MSVTRRAWLAAGAIAAFIVYGSLYPFAFGPLPEGFDAWQAFTTAPMPVRSGRGDALANLILYMPLGLALAVASGRRAAAATVLGFLLSAGMETAQLFAEGRTTSLWDLVLNTAGTAMGAAAAPFLRGRLGSVRIADGFAAALLACWLATRLYPYIPSLDLGTWRASLAPLAHQPLDVLRAARLAILWWLAARLLEAAVPGTRLLVPVMVIGVVAAAVPIADRVLTWADIAGAAGGIVLHIATGRGRAGALLLAPAVVVAVLIEGLSPYAFLDSPRDFGWVPFGAAMEGSWANGMQSLANKLVLHGGVLWALLRAGVPFHVAAAGAVSLAAGASVAQTWLPGRAAESTDALVAIAGVLAARLMPAASPAPPRPESKWRSDARRRRANEGRRAASP